MTSLVAYAVGAPLGALIETPVLLAFLSPHHSRAFRLAAGLALTPLSYWIVVWLLPIVLRAHFAEAPAVLAAELLVVAFEVALFAAATRRRFARRDAGAIALANATSFGLGVVFFALAGCSRTSPSPTSGVDAAASSASPQLGFLEQRWAERARQAKDPIACSRPVPPFVAMPAKVSPIHQRLQRECDGGSLESCVDLARRVRVGNGGPTNTRLAAQLFARACDDKVSLGCFELSELVREGQGVPENPACADALQAYACARGDRDACPEDERTARRRRRARHKFEETCAQGNYEACMDDAFAALQSRLDRQYAAHGTQDAHFTPAETAVFEKACVSGSERGCWALRVWSGPVLREACLAGVMAGCHPWDARDESSAPKATREEIEFACEHGVAEDCTWLGNASTLATAARYYERACPPFASKYRERDVDLEGCAKLGQVLREGRGVPVDRTRALDLLTRACFGKRIVHGVAEACVTLAQMLDAGEGVPADPSAATQAVAMACSLDLATCDVLAKRVSSGVGIAPDPEYARRLYKTACNHGTKLACLNGGDAAPLDLGGLRAP